MAQISDIPGWFKKADKEPCRAKGGGTGRGFVDKNIARVAFFTGRAVAAGEYSGKKGLLQAVSAKARVPGVLMLIAAPAAAHSAVVPLAALAGAFALALFSGVSLGALLKRAAPAVAFASVLAVPAAFSHFSPGHEMLSIGAFGHYAAITYEGARTAVFFVIRVASMVSLAALLLLTTRQADIFAGITSLPVPRLFVTMLFMSYRYLLMLLKTVEETMLARKSRTIGAAKKAGLKGWFASRVVFIMKKSLSMAEDVNMAMAARGFSGELKTFPGKALAGRDYLWLGSASFVFFLSLGL